MHQPIEAQPPAERECCLHCRHYVFEDDIQNACALRPDYLQKPHGIVKSRYGSETQRDCPRFEKEPNGLTMAERLGRVTGARCARERTEALLKGAWKS